jgi:hypothetical protein
MRIFLASIISLLISGLILGCAGSEGTSTGNPLVSLKFDSFSSTLALKASDITPQAVSSLTMCFKRLRFKLENEVTNPDPSQDEDNVDFYLGDVAISNLGTTLDAIHLPKGTYKRVEFDLDNDCPSGKSVQLTNSNGSFTSTSSMTIRFEGTFVHTGAIADLNLEIQQIVSALNTVTSPSQIKSKAEGVDGSF